MKHSIFLNDMLTKGAILGGVMLASNIVETSMMYYGATLNWVVVASCEIVAVIVLYCWLLLCFTRNYASLVVAERSDMPYFTYANGLNYAIDISMLAGALYFILRFSSAIFKNSSVLVSKLCSSAY